MLSPGPMSLQAIGASMRRTVGKRVYHTHLPGKGEQLHDRASAMSQKGKVQKEYLQGGLGRDW